MKNIESQQLAPQTGEVVLYNPDDTIRLEVRMNDETVWLTQAQMAELFDKSVSVVSRHIANIFAEEELEEKSNLHFLQIANSDKPVKYYSLDVIISVGYRVKSKKGTRFRQWANRVLKDYLLKGYSVNQRIERLEQLQLDIDRHNAQYQPIIVLRYKKSHDRFLILDDDVYHVGASLKDLGKQWFAIMRMNEITAGDILGKI
ncbi:MAG: virulence RhuM family protein [Bacteroidales bacterium]|nr:virulence RhuM family protein [Bacteroidales bacterium]